MDEDKEELLFILRLENVASLIKSLASQRGRDFAIILAYFRDLGYTVEWRVMNVAEYGYQRRRQHSFLYIGTIQHVQSALQKL